MGRISAAGIGSRSQDDPYHNEFIDTGSMLANALKEKVKVPVALQDQEIVRDEKVESGFVRYSESEMKPSGDDLLQKQVVESLLNLKNEMISMFQEESANPVRSARVEGMIRMAESALERIGVEFDVFDPLRNTSGLQVGEPLENAERVVANTLDHYRLYGISSAFAEMGKFGPSVTLSIFGSEEDVGFEVDAFVAAKTDFNGNEAIDYVWSKNGGLLTVKARMSGRWEDVSDEFVIDCKVKRYTLGKNGPGVHSLFLGEKIIEEGKGKIISALKAKEEDLTFGKCRVFSKDASMINKIVGLVKVNRE